MSMSTSIIAVRKKNLRHMYYGDPLPMYYRTTAEYPNLDQLRLQKTEREMKERILQSAKLHYTTPRLDPAPAFRCVSAAEAGVIAKRLYEGRQKRMKKAEDALKDEKKPVTPGNGPKLHSQTTYTFDVHSSRNPSAFIGRHQHVHNVAQPQVSTQ